MTNAEKYKNELNALISKQASIALVHGEVKNCKNVDCFKCDLNHDNCDQALLVWLLSDCKAPDEDFNYLETKKRYLNSIGRTGGQCDGVYCSNCLFSSTWNGLDASCEEFEQEDPKRATKLMKKWNAEHPLITNGDVFQKIYGCSIEKLEQISDDWWNAEYKEQNDL